MDYCDFPVGKYRALVTTHYKDELNQDKSIKSNYYYFESTQQMEEMIFNSVSVDVSHQYFQDNSQNKVWIAYIDEEDGFIHVKYSDDEKPYFWHTFRLQSMIAADKCGLCFNSHVLTENNRTYEFITDKYPFLYYIKDNTLYICNLNNNTTITVSEESLIDADMIRGPVALNRSYDLGLIVVFIAGDKVFYKQYINNIWYDAEVIPNLNIANNIFTEIKAIRTWDFRVGVLLKNIDNEIYQYITYLQGLSELNNEHIEMSISASGILTAIAYHNFKNSDEHVEMSINAIGNLLYGYSAVPTMGRNIEDSNLSWATTIQVELSHPNTGTITPSMFELTDTFDNHYVCQNATLSADGYMLTLIFDEFNAAYRADDVTVHYIAPSSGGLQSPAVQTNSFDISFIPQNLVDPGPPPAVYSIYNNNEDMKVYIEFDLDLTNDTITAAASHFSLSLSEYNYVPGGSLITTTRTLSVVDFYNNTSNIIELTINIPNFSSAIGDITVIYDGAGGLKGVGGPVAAFSETFTPTGLTWKGNQNNVEHIEMSISAIGTLTRITYHNAKSSDEHIEMSITATGVLTDIHDL